MWYEKMNRIYLTQTRARDGPIYKRQLNRGLHKPQGISQMHGSILSANEEFFCILLWQFSMILSKTSLWFSFFFFRSGRILLRGRCLGLHYIWRVQGQPNPLQSTVHHHSKQQRVQNWWGSNHGSYYYTAKTRKELFQFLAGVGMSKEILNNCKQLTLCNCTQRAPECSFSFIPIGCDR
jgi:hypothetical protein